MMQASASAPELCKPQLTFKLPMYHAYAVCVLILTMIFHQQQQYMLCHTEVFSA